jgi:DNA processing protein
MDAKLDGITKRQGTQDQRSDEVRAWLSFIRDRRWSLVQKRRLIDRYNNPAIIYARSKAELLACIKGRYKNTNTEVTDATLNNDERWLALAGNHLITFNDDNYPSALREIHDPPVALFVKGDLACLSGPIIAIVGSRRPSPIGAKLTKDLAGGLARLGISIGSGMALGIDGMAHQACLDAGTKTIAVMGCGLDIVYPARHRKLFADVVDNGCVVSEYPLGSTPTKYSFPQRNRIVSGLSLGVIIVEAAERSGTLITARLAAEQNRQVMVVPGSVFSSQYAGSNRLLKEGAALICGVDDVLFELSNALGATFQDQLSWISNDSDLAPPVELSHPILQYLSDQSSSVDQIIQASGLTAAEVSSMLLILEVDGVIAATDDGGYVRLV